MKKLPLRFAIACLSFGLISPVIAADNSISLDPVDVNGSRTASDQNILPQGAVVIDRQQLERMPVSNLAEALASVGGVNIQSYYGGVAGSYATPDIGGFGPAAGQNTLIMLDGRRLNTIDLSSINLGAIPLSAIDHVEIIPGSGSVLYGSGASGGIINIVTKSSYDNAGRFEGVVGELSTRGGSAQGSFSKDNINGIANVGRIGSDNYRDNNKSSQQQAFGDIRYRTEKTNVALSTIYNKQKIGLPGVAYSPDSLDFMGNPNYPYINENPSAAETPDNWAKDSTLHIMPSASFTINDNLKAFIDTGFRVREQRSQYAPSDPTKSMDRTLNVSPRLAGNFTAGLENRWLAGFDYYRTHYNHAHYDPFFQIDGQEHFKRKTKAIYGQNSIGLSSSTWLTLGARHEWIETNKNMLPEIDDKTDEVGTWSIGINQQLSDAVSLFANYERNTRYATVDELADGSLLNQTGKVATLGGKWQKDGQYSTLTLWHGKYRNEIAYNPVLFTNTNLDDTKRQGVSLNSYWKLEKNLWLALSGTYQEATFDKGANKGNNVPVVPRVTAYARADWQPVEQLTFSIAERYQGKQYFDNDQSNTFGKRIPSYRWMDLSATYRPTGAKSVYLSAILHNAENKKQAISYASTADYLQGPSPYTAYPLPGRYVIVKAGVDF